MSTADDVIVKAINECKMAPIISMIVIAGSAILILVLKLLFLVPLSRKMTNMAHLMFSFDVKSRDLVVIGKGGTDSVQEMHYRARRLLRER